MMKEQSSLSYLYGTNVPYIEDLYEAYLSSPDSVDSQWRQYFDQVAAMPGNTPKDVAHRPIQEAFANLAQQRGGAAAGGVDAAGSAGLPWSPHALNAKAAAEINAKYAFIFIS